MRNAPPATGSAFKRQYLSFRRIDPTPIRPVEFISPLFLVRYTSIMIPTVAYTIVFGFASVFATVEIPQIFIPNFHFGPQQLGLQFIGLIVGSIVGEQLGGPLSDLIINRRTKKLGGGRRPEPEYRLVLSYLGFSLAIVGLILFGIQVNTAAKTGYNISPVVMIGIAGAGNQVITTVLVSYAVDCHPEQSSSIGVFVNVIRSTWGFIGPFWFPVMIENIGIAMSGILMGCVVFAASVLPIVVLQLYGQKWRWSQVKGAASQGGRGD